MIRVDAALFAAAQAGDPVALDRMLRELQPDIRRLQGASAIVRRPLRTWFRKL